MAINTPKTLTDYKVYIESYIGNMFDITPHVVQLDITESIYNYSLSGSLRFVDNSALMTVIPIIGQERVHIILTKELQDSEVLNTTTVIMRVTEITSVQSKVESTASITLGLIDEKSYINDTSLFSRSMRGLDTDIIKKIHEDFIQPHTNMPINIRSNGTSRYDIIWPHVTPFEAFDTLLKYATDTNGTPLFLYDTLWSERFDYRTKIMSYYDMMQQKPKDITQGVVNNTDSGGDLSKSFRDSVNNATSVMPLGQTYRTSKMIRDGAFACSNIAFDLSRKSISNVPFNAFTHAPSVSNNVYSTRSLINDKSVYDYATTVQNTYIQNELSFHQGNPSLANQNLIGHSANKSYMARLNNTFGVGIEMDSNTDIRAGLAVRLDIDKWAPNLDSTDDMKDYLQSGTFIISDVTHTIKFKEYTLSVVAIRDGMGEEGKL